MNPKLTRTSMIYHTGGIEALDEIGPLWEKLNALHAAHSPHFSEAYTARTYADRKAGLLEKAQLAELRIDLARDSATGQTVGYCVSTCTPDGVGEIDSIYVESAYRGQGVGEALMRHALDWLESQTPRTVKLLVAVGNDQVLAFYRRFGFYPNHSVLQRKST